MFKTLIYRTLGGKWTALSRQVNGRLFLRQTRLMPASFQHTKTGQQPLLRPWFSIFQLAKECLGMHPCSFVCWRRQSFSSIGAGMLTRGGKSINNEQPVRLHMETTRMIFLSPTMVIVINALLTMILFVSLSRCSGSFRRRTESSRRSRCGARECLA